MIKINNIQLFFLLFSMCISGTPFAEKLTADQSFGSMKSDEINYKGNVFFENKDLTLKANTLSIKKTKNNVRELSASGLPLSIEQNLKKESFLSTANSLQFHPSLKIMTFKKNVALKWKQSEESMKIAADELLYDYMGQTQESDKIIILKATGSPITFQFQRKNKELIKAQAHQLSYSSESQEVILETDVHFFQESNEIKAEKLIFNLKTQEWRIPKTSGKQIEVLKSSGK